MYDLIIIGAGPAGVTAAVYAARKRMNFIVLTDDIGGQTTWSGEIENYTGYQFITGTDFVQKFEDHIKKYNVDVKESDPAKQLRVNDSGNGIVIDTIKGNTYESKTAIIASGKRSRELGVPGEKEFRKKGVTYCATCDGPLYANKDVAIVGGGNSGLEAALQMTKIARHIYLINVTEALTGDPILQEKVTTSDNVTVMHKTNVLEITGDVMVNAMKVNHGGEEKTLAVSGVFVEIGLMPNTEFIEGIEKNKWNEVIVNNRNETNIPFVFAAGDVTDVPEKQIIIAAGEGSKACLSAYAYLAYQKN